VPKQKYKICHNHKHSHPASRPRFVDLFAGCGGFSLGLIEANWKGVFAVEKDPMAFDTLRYNLVDGQGYLAGEESGFDWPSGLEKSELDIHELINTHSTLLQTLKGEIELVVGGPPCQGFSVAGRRKADDSRNELMHSYIEFIQIVEPNFLVVENVHGMAIDFQIKGREKSSDIAKVSPTSHAGRLISMLEKSGYRVFPNIIRALDLGIPQRRPRLILLGIKEHIAQRIQRVHGVDLAVILEYGSNWFEARRKAFLASKGLNGQVSVKDAIDDLSARSVAEAKGAKRASWKSHLIVHDKVLDFDTRSKALFLQVDYKPPPPSKLPAYVQALRKGFDGVPNSMRLANHREKTEENFRKLLRGRRGVSLSTKERKNLLGIEAKKHTIVVLHGDKPSHTITTLPDDILHYSEPRILTVRENARLQSFPDSFVFRGNYTTGSSRRSRECPRYTQVGNAVPPFLSEFLGQMVLMLRDLAQR
jgi:DNA (cytosine-5)-methyltransferase 1